MLNRIEADYLIETPIDLWRAAEVMAGEQSSGTFLSLPGETAELKERSAARIEALEQLPDAQHPSLPGSAAKDDQSVQRARVTVSWPMDNIGADLPGLMTTVAGNLFELRQFSGLRILDIRMPDAFLQAFDGPRFGIEGTRRLAGVDDRPLIGTIIKPSVGLSPAETAALAKELAEAGIDFLKDDELQIDGAYCPFEERVDAVMAVLNDYADSTGKKPMFAFNLSGDVDQMRRRHDHVLARGGTCIMASLTSVGLSGFLSIARHAQLPIHAHRNGWGYLSRAPMLGWSYIAWQKFWRLAGADHMHCNGIRNKFFEADESVVASARECSTPLSADKPCTVMPVLSSGQSAEQIGDTWKALRTPDLIYAAGGGIMGHPGGPRAGVASLKQGWEAAMTEVPEKSWSARFPELATAVAAFRK
ncbi:ribulose-bisphosphate carboxylase large subunit family protein [Devosia submarina]|uniref:ribulose-bisphosphate carboxylase large subunit family protein n=1 Tax=Devosia submarina TaxID=1173082 RepID=UPI000D336770|nr:ribulose-bisphosphate carboxylase large subunit family protein [Devosia submarina]